MESSPGSTKEVAFNTSLRSLGSSSNDSQLAQDDRAREFFVQSSGRPGAPQLFPHISLVSRRATFTSIDSFNKQGAHIRKDQAQMLKRNIISIISFMRSRTNSEETNRKKSKLECKTSGQTHVDRSDDSYDDSDEIPWFGATEATILAGRAMSIAPPEPKETDTEAGDLSDEVSDDYVAFQSSTKRRRLLSMFNRQERIVASGTLPSFETEALDVNMDDLYQLFTLLEATSTNPPSLMRRMNNRMPKFGISPSSRSLFKRH